MKYFALTLILSICTIAQSFAVNTYPAQTCDSLKLTDGRIVAVHILKQTDDRIFFTLCKDDAKKEGIILKRFVEAVIVNGRITQEPASNLKSRKRKGDRVSTIIGSIILWSGLAGILVYIMYALLTYGFFWIITR